MDEILRDYEAPKDNKVQEQKARRNSAHLNAGGRSEPKSTIPIWPTQSIPIQTGKKARDTFSTQGGGQKAGKFTCTFAVAVFGPRRVFL